MPNRKCMHIIRDIRNIFRSWPRFLLNLKFIFSTAIFFVKIEKISLMKSTVKCQSSYFKFLHGIRDRFSDDLVKPNLVLLLCFCKLPFYSINQPPSLILIFIEPQDFIIFIKLKLIKCFQKRTYQIWSSGPPASIDSKERMRQWCMTTSIDG